MCRPFSGTIEGGVQCYHIATYGVRPGFLSKGKALLNRELWRLVLFCKAELSQYGMISMQVQRHSSTIVLNCVLKTASLD